MAKAHGILTIIAAVLAAASALILVGGALFLPALLAVGGGIFVAVKEKDEMPIMATAGAGVLFGVLALIALGVGAGGFSNLAAPFAITACMAFAASALAKHWDDIGSTGSIIVAAVLGIGAVLAFVFNAQLAVQTGWQSYVVAVPALAAVYPGIVALKY